MTSGLKISGGWQLPTDLDETETETDEIQVRITFKDYKTYSQCDKRLKEIADSVGAVMSVA